MDDKEIQRRMDFLKEKVLKNTNEINSNQKESASKKEIKKNHNIDSNLLIVLLSVVITISIIIYFVPSLKVITKPLNIFVTFIHEGSHAIVALLTGGKVLSLAVKSDGSGVVYSMSSGFWGRVLTSSAGYLGASLFGVLLLLLNKHFSGKFVLIFSSILVFFITFYFAIITSLKHNSSLLTQFENNTFTIIAGLLLSISFFDIGKFTNRIIAGF